ncbi:hypothetical protein BLNAU_16682 [Blattamonas nauphoetae]|uniref:Uncharacterized protein n=1 Tax=Blattamonas nauphoetae TaxID=2049346 RepID=A0ABQ9X824_9EUKA|nr:hypothetical protein BLNAU_16682 [Blattamonas nauphoetae]
MHRRSQTTEIVNPFAATPELSSLTSLNDDGFAYAVKRRVQRRTRTNRFVTTHGHIDAMCGERRHRQKSRENSEYGVCKCNKFGQRVVLEADGREGKRTLKLSQDGETQPVYFTNIPVPFRFAVVILWENDAVEIKSVEVAEEPQLVGGTIPVKMDE